MYKMESTSFSKNIEMSNQNDFSRTIINKRRETQDDHGCKICFHIANLYKFEKNSGINGL